MVPAQRRCQSGPFGTQEKYQPAHSSYERSANKCVVWVYYTWSEITHSRALDVAIAGTACAQLSSFVRVPLLVKAVMPERTLGVVSRVLTLAVYTLEGV